MAIRVWFVSLALPYRLPVMVYFWYYRVYGSGCPNAKKD